jgi:hypothetical protein
MGYVFLIGQGVEFDEGRDMPQVKEIRRDDAPVFPGDEHTGNSNVRSPSYGAWHDFCKATGLYELFYKPNGNLIAGHPGYMRIDEHVLEYIQAALRYYRAKTTLLPGFVSWGYGGASVYDGNLARLIWLEYWCRWALENCTNPIIQNY